MPAIPQLALISQREKENAGLEKELEIIQENLKETKAEVKNLSHDKWFMGQEKATMIAEMNRLNATGVAA